MCVNKEGRKFKLVREGAYYRVVALRTFVLVNGKTVKPRHEGGLVEGEENLSQDGKCWVGKNAVVSGNARVLGDAYVGGNAIVCGDAVVQDQAVVVDDCNVSGNAVVRGRAKISGSVWVRGNSTVGSIHPAADGLDFSANYSKGVLEIMRLHTKVRISIAGEHCAIGRLPGDK